MKDTTVIPLEVKPNIPTITQHQFLTAIFGEHVDWAHVAGFPDDPYLADRMVWAGGAYQHQSARLDDLSNNNYYCISTFRLADDGKHRRRKALHFATYVIVIDDVNDKFTEAHVRKLGAPEPSFRIRTSLTSEQWGYILTVPEQDRGRVDALLDGLVKKNLCPDGKDPGMKGVTRYVRCLGTNTKAKYGTPSPVTELISWQPELKYSIEDLGAAFGIDINQTAAAVEDEDYINVPDHPIFQVVHAHGPMKENGYTDITCPRVHEHDGAADNGCAVAIRENNSVKITCFHSHTDEINGNVVVKLLKAQQPDWDDSFQWSVPIDQVFDDISTEHPVPVANLDNPLDLFSSATQVPAQWNREHYPKTIADLAADVSHIVGCDESVPTMAALTGATALCSDHYQLKVNQNNNHWYESARLWSVVVGDPSSKKTPGQKSALKPIKARRRELYQKIKEHNDTLDALTDEQLAMYEQIGLNTEQKPYQQYYSNDATIEAVADLCSNNEHGIAMFKDEMSGWFGSMDAYRSGNTNKDRPEWLMTFDGGPNVVNRKNRHTSVDNYSVSVFGAIQPGPMRMLANKSEDDGLLRRFLTIIVGDANPRKDEPGNTIIEAEWDLTTQALVTLRENITKDITLKLSPYGYEILHCIQNIAHTASRSPDMDIRMKAAVSKLEGISARLVVLYHLIEHAYTHRVTLAGGMFIPPPVLVADIIVAKVHRVVRDYFMPHQNVFYNQTLGHSEEQTQARWIAGHILAHGLEVITARDVYRSYKSLQDKEEIYRVMDVLVLSGWVVRSGKEYTWAVNPMVHELYADEAVKQKKDRKNTIAKIHKEGEIS